MKKCFSDEQTYFFCIEGTNAIIPFHIISKYEGEVSRIKNLYSLKNIQYGQSVNRDWTRLKTHLQGNLKKIHVHRSL